MRQRPDIVSVSASLQVTVWAPYAANSTYRSYSMPGTALLVGPYTLPTTPVQGSTPVAEQTPSPSGGPSYTPC